MKSSRKFFLLTAESLIVFVLCGSCSKPGSGADRQAQDGSTSLPDPCSLITQAEVDTAMGKGAAFTSAHNPRTGDTECSIKGTLPGLDQVKIIVHNPYLWDEIKKTMIQPQNGGREVSGLGDDAFEGRAIGYNVRKGNKRLQVFGVLTNKDGPNDRATRYLAERAVSRL
jgi:hypothetical protein